MLTLVERGKEGKMGEEDRNRTVGDNPTAKDGEEERERAN